MSAKDNFSRAAFEMFGVGQTAEKEAAELPEGESPASDFRLITPDERTGAFRPSTYLAPGTVMEGTLTAKGDVEIAGDFKGDITADGTVILRANANSNINCASLRLVSCSLTGDVRASSDVTVDEGSSVRGNIYAQDLECFGKIAGDLSIVENASFHQSASMRGNVATGTMTMDRGTVFEGSVVMHPPVAPPPPAPQAESAPEAGDGEAPPAQ